MPTGLFSSSDVVLIPTKANMSRTGIASSPKNRSGCLVLIKKTIRSCATNWPQNEARCDESILPICQIEDFFCKSTNLPYETNRIPRLLVTEVK
mmetsp:Transcript_6271/g.10112  ORF Transcript_6271/g.10112 Transcript_6271/m.10112 type:complete len:94 (+) Transcript_6271:994-1275(+)